MNFIEVLWYIVIGMVFGIILEQWSMRSVIRYKAKTGIGLLIGKTFYYITEEGKDDLK